MLSILKIGLYVEASDKMFFIRKSNSRFCSLFLKIWWFLKRTNPATTTANPRHPVPCITCLTRPVVRGEWCCLPWPRPPRGATTRAGPPPTMQTFSASVKTSRGWMDATVSSRKSFHGEVCRELVYLAREFLEELLSPAVQPEPAQE